MTRILHILDHSLPLHSGYSFRTRAIMKAQRDAGHDSRGLTGMRQWQDAEDTGADGGMGEASPTKAWDEPEFHDGLPFYRTHSRPYGPRFYREWHEIAGFTASILKLCKAWRPDVIHAHSPALCGVAAVKAGRKLGIPVVYEIRAFWEDAAQANAGRALAALTKRARSSSLLTHAPVDELWTRTEARLAADRCTTPPRHTRQHSATYRLTRALENRAIAGADAVMTICHGLRDDVIARGFAPSKIGVMPNGVDLTLFGDRPPPPANPASEASSKSRPPQEDAPLIGYIGSFYDYEGLERLIDAMPLILAEHPQARLLLIGSGPHTAALQRKIAGSPAASSIQYLGPVPHTEIAAHYSRCSIMVYPRKSCRLTELVTPLKPLEAMAQGVLVAASDIGGHRELISHGETGYLFAPDTAEACAEALITLLHNRAAWPSMRAKALARVKARHNWAVNAGRYEQLYQALLRGKIMSETGERVHQCCLRIGHQTCLQAPHVRFCSLHPSPPVRHSQEKAASHV